MDARKSLIRLAGLVCLLLAGVTAGAQETGTLERYMTVTGSISAGGQQSWTFSGADGEVITLLARATSGNLDPVLNISSSAGVLIGNDDYSYPGSQDALLESITLPRRDTYTVTVSGFGGTGGDYDLLLLRGFGELSAHDDFSLEAEWEAMDTALTTNVGDGKLVLAAAGSNVSGIARPTAAPTLWRDFYAEIDIEVTRSVDSWSAGLAVRAQEDGRYYVLVINQAGQWRFVLDTPDGDTILRDWTPHPAIRPGVQTFTLGLLAAGAGFDFFYNHQLIGRLSDATISDAGRIGVAVGTGASLTSETIVQFDNLSLTVPLLVNEARILPDQIITGSATSTVQELQRRGLLPAGGEMALTVSESFVESGRPGVHRFMLARGTTFRQMAISTTVSLSSAAVGQTGCGLVFGQTDDTHYTTAYIDQTGAYGVSRLDDTAFLPGVFGEDPELAGGRHNLLVIVGADRLHYYINGRYKGTLELEAVEGAVGNAVVNFEPINTSCSFTDTWLWRQN